MVGTCASAEGGGREGGSEGEAGEAGGREGEKEGGGMVGLLVVPALGRGKVKCRIELLHATRTMYGSL